MHDNSTSERAVGFLLESASGAGATTSTSASSPRPWARANVTWSSPASRWGGPPRWARGTEQHAFPVASDFAEVPYRHGYMGVMPHG